MAGPFKLRSGNTTLFRNIGSTPKHKPGKRKDSTTNTPNTGVTN